MNLIKSISKRLDNWYDKKYIRDWGYDYRNYKYEKPKMYYNIHWKSNNEGETFRWYGKLFYEISNKPIRVHTTIQFPFTKMYVSLSFNFGGYGADW